MFFAFTFSSFLHAEMIELKTQADFEEHLQSKGMSDSADKGIKRISPDKPAYKSPPQKKYKPKGMLVHFDFNSAAIRDYTMLNEFAKALQNKLSNNIILITGHTDSVGSDEFNLNLSLQRAQAVKDFLVQVHHINPSQLQIKGFGKRKLLYPNEHNESEARMNRRVELQTIGIKK
jgi:outer membrane protein OmpA-like peptidoglycan-associated protein